ncbi:MAG TPA: hypothetical protein VF110_12935 [Burkholderiales bacterium]
MTKARILPAALLVAAVAAINFLWMPGELLTGDPHAWREETRSILVLGGLHIPIKDGRVVGERGRYFVQNERDGLWYSKYGIANSLLALPPMWLERALGKDVSQPGTPSSLLVLNLWYVGLSVALAALLYSLSGAYSRRAGVRALFVFASLYCTSLWFYQRAQASELYQTLFFTAFFAALIGFLRPLREQGPAGLSRRAWACLGVAWLCAAALIFTRVIYGLLLPLIVCLAVYCGARWRRLPPLLVPLLVPPLAIVALLGWVNYVKFGAPWLTGYHQWNEASHYPVGSLFDGLWGFLFSPRFSIFLYFPLLIFALAGLRRFAERHRLDALVMLSVFACFLLVLAKTPSWAGEWSYGPRYLLPMLPVLSLPFLTFADDVIDRVRTWPARAWAAAAISALCYSAYLQAQVNLLPFWSYYEVRGVLLAARPLESIEYFLNRPTAFVVQDLLRHRYNVEALPFFSDMARNAPGTFAEHARRELAPMLARNNLYWSLPPAERR